MHPVLARYLNLQEAQETLQRADAGEPLSEEEERPYIEAAKCSPDQRAQVASARSRGKPPTQTQEALIYLAAHAAARALEHDAELHGALTQARTALMAEGASAEDVFQLLASMVLEEAFGYDSDEENFDRPFFEETLRCVPELARLTQDKVRQLVVAYVNTAEPDDRLPHGAVAQALIEVAWEDGPEPINPEHVEAALSAVLEKSSDGHKPRAVEGMRRFVGFLARSGLVGPLRQAELHHAIQRVAADVPGAGGLKN